MERYFALRHPKVSYQGNGMTISHQVVLYKLCVSSFDVEIGERPFRGEKGTSVDLRFDIDGRVTRDWGL